MSVHRAAMVVLALALGAAPARAAPPCLPDGVTLGASSVGSPTICTTTTTNDGLPAYCWDVDPHSGDLLESAPEALTSLAARGLGENTVPGRVSVLDEHHLGIASWGLRELTVVDVSTGQARSIRRTSAARGCTRRELADLADGFDQRVGARCAREVSARDAPLVGAQLMRLDDEHLLALLSGGSAGQLRILDDKNLNEVSRATVATCKPPRPITCQPIGRWSVTWTPVDAPVYVRALQRTFTFEVDATGATLGGWMDLPGRSDNRARVEVDRTRCLATLDLQTHFSFADDAGTRTEHLTLELDLRGDGGNARGAVHLVEVGHDPEDRRAAVGGRVRRSIDAP